MRFERWRRWRRAQRSALRPFVLTVPGWRLTPTGVRPADRLVVVMLEGRPWR